MVKPVELQDSLSKTPILEKVQTVKKSAPDEAQKQFAQELQKKVASERSKVVDLPKSDKILIHRDDTKKKDDQQESKKKKQKKKNYHDNKRDSKHKNIDYLI